MKLKLSKFAIIGMCVAFVMVVVILLLLWRMGVFVTDRSAAVYIEHMTWKGQSYSQISGHYTEGRTIAKSEDGSWKINEVKEDPSHTFVVARSFLDDRLYVSDDYTIPTDGEITTICWNREYIEDKEFIKALSEIDAAKTTSFAYETERIFELTENQRMKELYFAYEDCPVATVYKGYLGKINGQWAITTDGGCYSIPDKYSKILEKYFFE